jgi:GntR family transcriptional regulator/MocR family aminotransferase
MDLVIVLDISSPIPLNRQLFEEMRAAILQGRLRPGQRLPSIRALATHLRISRNTITHCFEQLIAEGYAEAKMGSGTFVKMQIPEDLLTAAPSPPGTTTAEAEYNLSSYARLLPQVESETAHYCRSAGPDFSQFPIDQWKRLISRYCQNDSSLLDYSYDFQGYRPLRQEIASYLRRARALQCDEHQMIIVNGSQQGLYSLSTLFVERGDTVFIEDPGYLGARRVFEADGANLVPVEVDEEGIRVDLLPSPGTHNGKLLYITPSHQFPKGVSLAFARRNQLLQWAKQSGVIIVEDDYDSEFRYDGRPLPALQGLDQECVVYLGTFSKTLFPALRIAYMVVPPSLVDTLCRVKWFTDRQSHMLEQYILKEFIANGSYERHIRRMRLLYETRRNLLVKALSSALKDTISITGEEAGMHLIVRFNERIDPDAILASSDESGLEMVSLEPYYAGDGGTHEFIVGFSRLEETTIDSRVAKFAAQLQLACS